MLRTANRAFRRTKPADAKKAASAQSALLDATRVVCTGVGTLESDLLDPAVWDLAGRAGLAQFLAAHVLDADHNMVAAVPLAARAVLRWASMNHLRTIAELRKLAALFDGAGIRWLVFKGPVLADVVYARSGIRMYGDLDVLVHPADLQAALEILAAGDTALVDRNWAHIRSTEQSEISLRLAFGTLLDLHWHVISNPQTRAEVGLPIVELFAKSVVIQLGGVDVRTLDPIDTLCHLCLHAALSGGHQLRWLVDIQQAVVWARPDPAELLRRSAELGCELVVSVMLQRVVGHVDRGVLPLLRAVRRRSVWTTLCALVDRIVSLDPDDTAYSGRAIFSSTRATSAHSLQAAMRALRLATASGRNRRNRRIDMSVLHNEGGDLVDRDAWLALAGTHA